MLSAVGEKQMDRESVERLAREFFGSGWSRDARLVGFVEALTADGNEGLTPEPGEPASSLEQLDPAHLFRLVLDTIPSGVFWKDRDSRFVGANQRFACDIGLDSPTDALGLDDFEFTDAALAEEYRSIDRSVMENDCPIVNFREPLLRGDQVRWLETNKIPLHAPDGQVIGLLGTYADVTDDVAYEEKLSSANAGLEQASRFKDRFLASISHELRTPLNPILALSESLRAGIYGPVADRQHEALDRLIENASKLHRLVEDVLEVSQFEFGEKVELAMSPTRIAELFEKMARQIRPSAEAKQITVEVDPGTLGSPGHYYIDNRRVEKALAVLLDNAIKFTGAGGNVRLSAEEHPATATVCLSVSDDGIGIAAEHRENIFDSFEQVDRELARAYNGAGIGLAIARHVAEQHGGSIELTSEPGCGSTFTIILPARTSAGEPAAST